MQRQSPSMLFQLTTGRGILNDEFAPVLKRIEDREQDLRSVAREKLLKYARHH